MAPFYRDGVPSHPFLPPDWVYPQSWTCFSSNFLGMLTERLYPVGHPDDTASSMRETTSHATPDHVFSRVLRSGDITIVLRSIGRLSPCGPETQVNNTVRHLLRSCRVAYLILSHKRYRFPYSSRSTSLTTHQMVSDVWSRLALRTSSRGCR